MKLKADWPERIQSCLFGADKALRMRSTQSALVMLFMTVVTGAMLVVASAGIVPWQHAAIWATIFLGGAAVFLVLVRSGLSTR